MAIIKAVSSHAPISTAIDYVSREEKTEERLLSGINCMPETAEDEMQATKELYGKTGGRTYKHFVQSFAPGEEITPEQAHELAVEYANKCESFQGYEVLVATHKDKDHVHTHFIVNSVSYEDGHKFQMSAHDLQKMKDLSDDMCMERGLSICEKGKTFEGEERTSIVAYIKEKYQYLNQAEDGKVKAYVRDTTLAVNECRSIATSQNQFILMMNERGYEVDWQERHKHITFTDKDGHKVRDTNISKTYNLGIDKEQLAEQFRRNLEDGRAKQLDNIRDNLIRAEYTKVYLERVGIDIQRETNLKKNRLETAYDTYTRTKETVGDCRRNIKEWKEELSSCNIFQVKKKNELRENIEHAQAKIEASENMHRTVLNNCGFSSQEELQEGIKDYKEAVKRYEEVEEKRKQLSELQSKLYKEYEKRAAGSDVERGDWHRQNVEDELREKYGKEFNNVTYEHAEKTVEYRLSNPDDDRDVSKMNGIQRMEYYKEIVNKRFNDNNMEKDLHRNLDSEKTHSHDMSR